MQRDRGENIGTFYIYQRFTYQPLISETARGGDSPLCTVANIGLSAFSLHLLHLSIVYFYLSFLWLALLHNLKSVLQTVSFWFISFSLRFSFISFCFSLFPMGKDQEWSCCHRVCTAFRGHLTLVGDVFENLVQENCGPRSRIDIIYYLK